jgi:signal transduction histidine kinase
VVVLASAQGLDTGTVMVIDAHRGHTWIGGERGLERFDGRRFRPVLLSDGRTGFAVSGIDELANGDLWLNTTDGVIWITAEEVDRICRDASYRARYRLFDAFEGMPGSPAGLGGLPSLSEGTDGRLWFATSNGVVWLNPTLLAPHNSPPPSVFIEEIASRGQRYPATASVTLPMRTTDLQIGYTAPSLSTPERIGFRYRLEGVDHEWREVGSRRVAYYTNVPPGEHRFSVNASNIDGIWSNAIAQETLIIPATFRQTKAFTALYLCAGAALIFTVFVLRVRQVKSRVRERFELRAAERTRLAQDLHDTLLQTIQACKLAVENALDQADMTQVTRDNVNRLHMWLDRAAHEGRAALNALRSEAPRAGTSTLELTQTIEAAGDALMLTYPAGFRVHFQGRQLYLQERVYGEFALIVTEAVQNAFKHAGAREIEVAIYSSRWRLLARVKDDGNGFEAANAGEWMPAGHWGIRGMLERAKRIRAELRIRSAPGAGTTVELRILHLATSILGVSV